MELKAGGIEENNVRNVMAHLQKKGLADVSFIDYLVRALSYSRC